MAVNGRGHLIRQRLFGERGLHPSLKTGAAAPGMDAWYYWHSAYDGNAAVQCNVVTGFTEQGMQIPAPIIPGRQYTASAYVQQSQPNTMALSVVDLEWYDHFSHPTSTTGWQTAVAGGAWTTTGGSASDYTTASSTATITQTTVNVVRGQRLGTSVLSANQLLYGFSTAVLATGSYIEIGSWARYTDASNYYRGVAQLNTDQTITVAVVQRAAGTETVLASTTSTLTHSINTQYNLRFALSGNTLQARLWATGTTEPTTWDVTTTDTTPTLLTGAGNIGVYSRLNTGNTNTNPVLTLAMYNATNVVQIGTTSGAVLTWVRLSVTFTATGVTDATRGLINTVAAQTAGGHVLEAWMRWDDVQVEPGGSASAFTTSGPMLRNVWNGFVERWPATWDADSQGFLGKTTTPLVGPLALLTRAQLHTEYVQAVQSLAPAYYWQLNEPFTATLFGDSSGNSGSSLGKIVSKDGPAATFTPGTSTGILGNPNGTGLADYSVSVTSTTATAVGVGPGNAGFILGGSTSTVSVSAAVWIAHSGDFQGAGGTNSALTLVNNNVTNTNLLMDLAGGNVPPDKLQLQSIANGVTSSSIVNDSWADGLPHLYVCVSTFTSSNVTTTLYVDGTQVATNTAAGASSPPYTANVVQLAGYVYASTARGSAGWPNAVYSHLALWNRALSTTEIATLASAGGGYSGEHSGTRVSRYLAATWIGPTAVDTGASVMGPSDLAMNTPTLSACQAVAVSEGGNFYESANAIAFESRTTRFLNLTSVATFGEDVANGEIPYIGDIEFDYDPTFIINDIDLTNFDGVVVTVDDDTSQKRYGIGSLAQTVNLLSDLVAIDDANFKVATLGTPGLRVNQITVDLGANPTLAPKLFVLEIGNRVTVKRRAKAANSGVGITMSMAAFIENIEHHSIDFEQGTWQVTFLVSPVPQLQPFIFDDPTYGTFDGPGVFGW